MASLPKEFTICCEIAVKLGIADTKELQKFTKKLIKLCKKYGYAINYVGQEENGRN